MNKIKRAMLALLCLAFMVGLLGCTVDYKQLIPGREIQEEPLIKVQIQFIHDKQVECFVKSLGLEQNAEVYNGGASLNYMYDQNGQILGSFNYSQVIYMQILPDPATD
jgi:hypothetical protein